MSFQFNSLKGKLPALKFEPCLSRAPGAKTIALRAISFPSKALPELLKATLCWLKASVKQIFLFRRDVKSDLRRGFC